jgi:mutator protein MutT
MSDQPPKQIAVAVAVIVHPDTYALLICQRPDTAVLGGFWEFPGGKRDPGESLTDCAQREVREELGISVSVRQALTPIEHRYPHAHVKLFPFVCRYDGGEPQTLAVARFRWVRVEELDGFEFPPANQGLLAEIKSLYAQGFAL